MLNIKDADFTYTYDPNGNMISKTSKTTGETTTYGYDAENQLTLISSLSSLITYRYDGLGRRIEKNVNGVITRYIYGNEGIIFEYDGSNRLLATYLHGPGIDEPLMMERDIRDYYYIPDALGSIRALVDGSGHTRQMYEYDAFGEIKIFDQEGIPIPMYKAIKNPYTFTGREYDPESGLYYYRARYYDPRLGRFLQEDVFKGSLILPISQNLYLYVEDAPINFIDPFGFKKGKWGSWEDHGFEHPKYWKKRQDEMVWKNFKEKLLVPAWSVLSWPWRYGWELGLRDSFERQFENMCFEYRKEVFEEYIRRRFMEEGSQYPEVKWTRWGATDLRDYLDRLRRRK
ncbi:TPA: hypothetical protein DCX15_00600 [bacterium]|nr:hypothetical protein [bacterium]